ncbi:MAG TPA: hypothetical protein VGE91_04485 [Solirubrobacterales bacterium]
MAGLVLALAASGTLLLLLQSRLTFFGDDWEFLLERRGFSADAFLNPHNDHIVILPVTIYKVLLGTLGMSSALPFQVVSTSVFLLSAIALFVYLRRRVGGDLAFLGTTLILFLGASWVDLLWSFQVALSGSIAAGLAALLALEREEPRRDAVACALLAVSTAFSELGVAFCIGALVNIALGPYPRRRRLYVALTPLALYAIWFLGWGHTARSSFTLHNLLVSPKYVFEAVSQAIASLLGLATPLTGSGSVPVGLIWGEILLVIGIALAAWRLRILGRISRGLWTALALGGAFWLLAAANTVHYLRDATNQRYVYPGAVFVLMIAAELMRDFRPSRRTLIAAGVVTAGAVTSGVIFLDKGYRAEKASTDLERARLAAAEIARPDLSADSIVRADFLTPLNAGAYFSAVDAFGSFAFSESRLSSSSEANRVAADQALAVLLRVRLGEVPDSAVPAKSGRGCRQAGSTNATGRWMPLEPGVIFLTAEQAPATLGLARFADRPSVQLGSLGHRQARVLDIPADLSARPWHLQASGPGSVTVCGPGS